MKKIVLILLLAFSKMNAQDTIYFKKVDDFRRMYFEVGLMKPQGNLSDKFDESCNLGVWFRNRISKNQFIDVGVEVNLLVKPREVGYNFNDSIVKFESSKSGLKIGFRYSGIIPLGQNNSDFNIETNTGIGWSALYYSIPDHYDEHLSDRLDKKTNLHTIFLSQTIKFNVYDFGVFCSYYYAPYTMFTKGYENQFGAHSISFGIVYRL